MDVVYTVRAGGRNEELRFSLRSLVAHLPHDQVWIAGGWPTWVTGVRTIPVPDNRLDRWQHSTANLLAACLHPGISDEFAFFNDDFFVMAPMERIPTLHRGPIDGVLRQLAPNGRPASPYLGGMVEAEAFLQTRGVAVPLSYEIHVPMVIRKEAMAEVIQVCAEGRRLDSQKRSIYGNLEGLGGERSEDFKVLRGQRWDDAWPFISTTDHGFASDPVGRMLRARFPEPSPYERT